MLFARYDNNPFVVKLEEHSAIFRIIARTAFLLTIVCRLERHCAGNGPWSSGSIRLSFKREEGGSNQVRNEYGRGM